MRKLRTRIGAMIASVTLAVAMMAMPAGATSSYTGIAGTTTSFKKYLVADEGVTIPAMTFEYEIHPINDVIAATDDTVAVYPGPVVMDDGKVVAPAVGTAVFATGEKLSTTVATGDSVTLASGQAYAKKTVDIDLTGVSFTEPGVYRYILTEQTISDMDALAYDVQRKSAAGVGVKGQRTLDVYVTDSTTNEGLGLTVSGYVLHELTAAPAKNAAGYGTGDVTEAGNALADKSDGFVNSLETYDLEFGKTVDGNQASRDKYFAITVELSKLAAGTSYKVSYGDDSNPNTKDGNADTEIAANPNAATTVITSAVTQPNKLSVSESATSVSQTFYVQHGQSIIIHGLPKGTDYKVTENAEDYKPSVEVTGESLVESNKAEGTIEAYTLVAFHNVRNGIIPTGVLLSVAPWVIAGIVIIGGIVFFAIRSKKKYEEE